MPPSLPFVDRGIAHVMLAAQIRDETPKNPDDPVIREAAAFHVLVLSLGQNELQTGLSQKG
jgi:hypothetical protein